MRRFRHLLKSVLFTHNTIRYRVEYARLVDCLRSVGRVECVFDGGAAAGEMISKLLADGHCARAIAMEFDEAQMPKLRANFQGDCRVRVFQGSLTDVELPDACVDLAMSTQVIEHIADHEKAAAELARVTKPGGHVLVSVPHPPERMPNPGHVRPGYTEEELKALFQAPHFTHLRTEYFLTLPTLRRIIAATELPLRGIYMPLGWVDRETHLTAEQRQADDPYGIMCLFRRRAA